MGYKIIYGPQSIFEKKHNRRKSIFIYFAGIIVVAAAVILARHFTGNDWIDKFMLPGDADITAAAFSEMTETIRHGGGFKEAITTFCREIIQNAQIS